jgi:hypothetical protein
MKSQFIAVMAVFGLSLSLGEQAIASILTTERFRIEVKNNCDEGVVSCDRVSYQGVNLRTGRKINLMGRTIHKLCKDRVTLCQFIGYEFRNGNYRYFLGEAGYLVIYKGKKQVFYQAGIWHR